MIGIVLTANPIRTKEAFATVGIYKVVRYWRGDLEEAFAAVVRYWRGDIQACKSAEVLQVLATSKKDGKPCLVRYWRGDLAASAGDHWKDGKPCRVLRSYKLAKHSKFAPKGRLKSKEAKDNSAISKIGLECRQSYI